MLGVELVVVALVALAVVPLEVVAAIEELVVVIALEALVVAEDVDDPAELLVVVTGVVIEAVVVWEAELEVLVLPEDGPEAK